ncbi:MAG: phosphatidylglycerol lysyltransferase domain-containing protein [Oscillospiraceae bacterium]|nr:phosphatidylglycerol lysyltransferase domain-containing protein [Oscillospiraceae bacterium]
MLKFKPLELSDKEWIDETTFGFSDNSADYNFGNMYMWDHLFSRLVTRCEGRMVSLFGKTYADMFDFPVGKGDLVPVIEEMRLFARRQSIPFRIRGVTPGHRLLLEQAFPGEFTFKANRDQFDYVYSAEKLATLAGKKLHGKRNHINKFISQNEWSFEPMSREMIPECSDMLDRWTMENREKLEFGLETEHRAVNCGFKNFEALKLEGGVLRAGGRIAAFTIGEPISADTYNVHFEKAGAGSDGAYQMINREFVRQILQRYPDIRYINREDDMGIANLRQAKSSYHPEFLTEKHTAYRADRV